MVRRKALIRKRVRKITTLKVKVHTRQSDIDNGVCKLANKCMEKLAVSRALSEQLNLSPDEITKLHVRVDGGHIRFNYDAWRWVADTPIVAKDALIRFDRDKNAVKPHSYTITARQTTRVAPMTAERRNQINQARNRRIREGRPDRVYSVPTIRERIVGFAEGRT